MLAALLLLAAVSLTASVLEGQEPSAVHGVVRNESTGAVLPGAVVELRSGTWSGRALADRAGAYRLEAVPAGRGTLRARLLGHAVLELQILVPAGREVRLDLSLPVQPIALAPVTVEGVSPRTGADAEAAPEAELGLVGVRALGSTPGIAELGLGDAVRGLPGNDPADPASVLFVKGAAADLKLVYLDGAPVYAPFPLGGILDPFSPGLLRGADVYLGGAPARYDGGLSYIMDLRTRAGRRDGVHADGSVDLLAARATVEAGAEGRGSLIASARGIHPLADVGVAGGALPYAYHEAIVRADVQLGGTGVLSLTGFTNAEAVRLSEEAAESIEWGNRAGSVRYAAEVEGTMVDLSVATGSYDARLPLLGTGPMVVDGTARRSRAAADLLSRAGGVNLRYGASLDLQEYRAGARQGGEETPESWIGSSGAAAGAYGEVVGQPGPRVRIRGGLRLDRFSGSGTVWAPRVAATWLVTERAALTLAAGRYHQFLRPPEEIVLRSADPVAMMPAELTLGRASHLAVALDQDLGEGVRLGVEGYFKDFSGVPGAYATEANASGVDLWVRRASGFWTGWIGYSLAWAWSPPVEGPSGTPSGSFTGRHLLTTAAGVPIGSRAQLDVRFAYGAGLPYSAIALHSDTRSGPGLVEQERAGLTSAVGAALRGGTETAPLLHPPTEPYLRLDASLSGSFHPRSGTRIFELTPYLRVLNSLGRRDGLFYFYERARGPEPRAVGSLPIVPVVGVEWKL